MSGVLDFIRSGCIPFAEVSKVVSPGNTYQLISEYPFNLINEDGTIFCSHSMKVYLVSMNYCKLFFYPMNPITERDPDPFPMSLTNTSYGHHWCLRYCS